MSGYCFLKDHQILVIEPEKLTYHFPLGHF